MDAIEKQKASVEAGFLLSEVRLIGMRCFSHFELWCPGPESNRHALRRRILSPLRLPIPPPGLCWESLFVPRLSIPSCTWLRGLDLNQRPLGYEPNELPDCSTSR